jgi:hypothetical protein
VTGGNIAEVYATKHQTDGTIVFSEVRVGRLVIDNNSGSDPKPGHYVFESTGLTCGDVAIESVVAGTTVAIDGVSCPLP